MKTLSGEPFLKKKRDGAGWSCGENKLCLDIQLENKG